MKHNPLIIAILVMLAGCSQSAAPTQALEVAAVTAVATPGPASIECAQPSGYQLMPAGVDLAIPFHLRADRLYHNEQGQARRRIVLEYLDGDVDSTLASVGHTLITSGFSARPQRDAPNGNIVVPYVKQGFGSIIVVANASPGANLSNPSAKGTVVLDFPRGEEGSVEATATAASL